jgi:hypothetical protein
MTEPFCMKIRLYYIHIPGNYSKADRLPFLLIFNVLLENIRKRKNYIPCTYVQELRQLRKTEDKKRSRKTKGAQAKTDEKNFGWKKVLATKISRLIR